jgi:hypothetical protein
LVFMRDVQPRGRADLLASIRAHLPGGVLLTGVAGIGKSTVLAAAVAEVSAMARVLCCRSARTDADLPFLALADLLEPVPEPLFERLPAIPRRALDAALQRGDVGEDHPEPLAVRLAVRPLLRELGERGPVVVAVDDLQWVDADSAQVLAYALRRLSRSEVSVLAAERVEPDRPSRFRSLLPEGTVELAVGPMDEDALATLVRERTGGHVRRPLAAEICRVTEGNPLFALEIGDAVVRQGRSRAPGAPLPVPEPVRALLAQRFATVSAGARVTLLCAAASPGRR